MEIDKKIRRVLFGLCMVILLSANIVYAAPEDEYSESDEYFAQETEESIDSQEARAEALETIMFSNPQEAEAPVTSRPEADAIYHKDFEYGTDVVLSGVFQTNTFYFLVEDYWDCTYAFAEMQIDVSQLISDVPASLTFMVNNTPVVSYLIDYVNGQSQTFYVEIPTRLLNEGYNSFSVTGYARIFDEDGCMDDFNGANWVSIRKESYVQVGYGLKPHEQKISYFPYPFISSIDSTGGGSYVSTSSAMTDKELSAALTLRAVLAAKTDREDQIRLINENDIPLMADGIILISEYDNLSSQNKSLVDEYISGNDLETKALVLFTEKSGVPTMIITSEDGDCLMEAVSMLMDEDRASQEQRNAAFVDKGGIELMQEVLAENMTASGRYTLDALTESGLEFIGPFHQETRIYLPFSGGYVLSESSKVVLNFRYSENLNFDRSMITVYWGEIPVASKKLMKENAGGDELSFTMPNDVIGTHADSIKVAFELELPELFCTPRMDEMPWAYISDDSVFYLPVGVNTSFKFDLRPYPFEQGSVFNNLVVVIPDEMEDYELQALGQMVAVYGENLEPYGNIEVVRAGNITGDLKKNHLIVFGTYQDNAVIRELNDHLGFRFNEDGSAFTSNTALILSDEYSHEIVTMQMFSSPFESGRAILVCSSASKEGFENLSAFLEKEENIWQLAGDTVLIDNTLDIKTYDLHIQDEIERTPLLKRLFEDNRDSTIFAIVSLAAMLLLLLSVILIFIRVYWNQRSKK